LPRPPIAWLWFVPLPFGLLLPAPAPPPPAALAEPFVPEPPPPEPFAPEDEVSASGNGEGISSTESECGFGKGPVVTGMLLISVPGVPPYPRAAAPPKAGRDTPFGVGEGDGAILLRSFRVMCGRDCESSVASVGVGQKNKRELVVVKREEHTSDGALALLFLSSTLAPLLDAVHESFTDFGPTALPFVLDTAALLFVRDLGTVQRVPLFQLVLGQ
jgi:hypothetical protein